MACFNCCKPADESEEMWTSRMVKEAVEKYSVTMFVDSNNSTCDRLRELLNREIGVDVYVVEIDKMNYHLIERELERLTGCRITPHVFVQGKFFGGEDLFFMYENGELVPKLLGAGVECKFVDTDSPDGR